MRSTITSTALKNSQMNVQTADANRIQSIAIVRHVAVNGTMSTPVANLSSPKMLSTVSAKASKMCFTSSFIFSNQFIVLNAVMRVTAPLIIAGVPRPQMSFFPARFRFSHLLQRVFVCYVNECVQLGFKSVYLILLKLYRFGQVFNRVLLNLIDL